MRIAFRRCVRCLLLTGLLTPIAAHAQTGTISGTVRLEGSPPAPRMIEITKNQEFCGDEIEATDVVVDAGRVQYAVAFVEGLEAETESREYLLSNSDCRFDPPVLATTVGSVLVVDNQDDVMHNTHLNFRYGERTRTVGNWALSTKGSRIAADRPLRRAGVLEVECDAHPWMHSMIYSFAHPYFSVTDSVGAFEIGDVPEGTHVVKVLHEVFGELEQEVTVHAGATKSVDFVFTSESGTPQKSRQP